jgi:hypothetical protein
VGSLSDPAFRAHLRELGTASDRLWLLALTIGLAFTLVAAYGRSGDGNFWAYACLLLRGAFYLTAGERLRGHGGTLITRLFALGVVAGMFELLVDWGLVHWVSTGRLVYLGANDVVLLASPVWMPLAWACVTVELGYPALRLFGALADSAGDRRAAAIAAAVGAVAAAVTVGFYEYFAFRAGWWRYESARVMIGSACAAFIPVGEGLMFLALPWIAARSIADADRAPRTAAVTGGLRFACAIAAGYAAAYLLLEVR